MNLFFAELFIGVQNGNGDGARLFDVFIEGTQVLDNYDIHATAGDDRIGLLESFDVSVLDGNLDVDLLLSADGVDNAKIGAIEIVQKGAPGGPLTYANVAELFAADQVDPDSTPNNGDAAEDDYAIATVIPTATGVNAVGIALVADAAEPATDGQFAVTLEEAAAIDTVVTYTVGGTATAGADYAALTGTVTIAAGDLSAVIVLPVLDDLEVEDDETVVVTLTGATGEAGVALGTATEATATIASDDLPPVQGSVLVEITPGGGLGASTYGGTNGFQITNTGPSDITSISIDLSTAILPDMVFDPIGAGGDDTAQVFSPGGTAAAVGLVPVGDPAADPFSGVRNGGYDVITLNFTDFNATEFFQFGVDVDPNSIQGVPGAGNAGAVSGYELIGSTLTVTFSDGTSQTVATGSLYEEGTLGGSQAVFGQGTVSTSTTLAAPTIALVGGGADESLLPGDQQSVALGETAQVVRVTGEAGANVSLLQVDARLFIASGEDPFDVTADELPFYANEAMDGKALYSGVLDENGVLEIAVDLLTTAGSGGTPDGGLNHFMAVLSDEPYAGAIATSQTSEVLVVRQVAAANAAPVITTADAFQFVEGDTAAVFTATATDADGDTVTFTLGGDDAFLFDFDGTTATFKAAPDFDDGGENAFDLTLTASDETESVEQDIVVSVLKDSDGDLVPDLTDNATFVANPNQRDTDGDGYGNVVDADLNNDGIVLLEDLALFREAFGQVVPGDDTGPFAHADFDGDGFVLLDDLSIFRDAFGTAPGPSAEIDFL